MRLSLLTSQPGVKQQVPIWSQYPRQGWVRHSTRRLTDAPTC